MIQFSVQSEGLYRAYGLSTDTKPVTPPDNCLFFEVDTALIFASVGGEWVIKTTGSNLTLSDVTTNNADTAKHGFLPKLDGLTTTFLRGDGTFATPPGGSGTFAITETEIDFGTTPLSEKSFTITNGSITAGMKIIAFVSYAAPTSKDQDELEMDDLQLRAVAGTGNFVLYVKTADGSYLADKFKINYTYA